MIPLTEFRNYDVFNGFSEKTNILKVYFPKDMFSGYWSKLICEISETSMNRIQNEGAQSQIRLTNGCRYENQFFFLFHVLVQQPQECRFWRIKLEIFFRWFFLLRCRRIIKFNLVILLLQNS